MEEKKKNKLTVKILGEEYILRGSTSVEEMTRIALYVDNLMKSLVERNPHMSKQKIAVLAAINLADELLKIKAEPMINQDRIVQNEKNGDK